MVAVEIPKDAETEERAAPELLPHGADVGEEPAVVAQVGAEIGIPDAAQIVFGVGDEATHGVVAAAIAETPIGRVDAVIHEARPVGLEVREAFRGAVDEAADRPHPALADTGRTAGTAQLPN
ncbi:MAG: hypothetical protein NTY17_01975, partial [Planctomycetia bacterium]|nr:hypothetical protein [Planctomycetia bacterium]